MSNLNLEPFELSKWNEVLVTQTQEEDSEENLINIYRGLSTSQDELDFWYLPRRWNGASFSTLSEDNKFNKYKVIVNIDKPEDRDEDLVHIDFSTSNLDFKPNTYYTFLLQLDFDINEGKLPDWKPYQAVHPETDTHYLISLVRQDVPESIWHMPKPIFDSSLAISYGQNGFNLKNSQFNKEHEVGQLFTYSPKKISGEDDIEKTKVILIGCLKTNDFLKENSTLGMWSFLESWINDYWKAAMEIYVFEDNIVSETVNNELVTRPEVYSKIYKKIKGEDYIPLTNMDINLRTITKDLFKKCFPKEEPISQECAFYGIKQEIDRIIRNYYTDLRDYIQNFKNNYVKVEGENKNFYQALLEDETFQFDYAISTDNGPQFIKSGSKLIKKVSQAGLEAAQVFYSYFPDLTFPYKKSNNTIISYHSNNFTSNYSDNIITGYLSKIEGSPSFKKFVLSSNILFNPIYIEENAEFRLSGSEQKDILLTITDEFINKRIETYWENLCPKDSNNNNDNNEIYNFLNSVYGLDDLEDDKLLSFAKVEQDDSNLSDSSLELFFRRGATLFRLSEYQELISLLYKYSDLINFNQFPSKKSLSNSRKTNIKKNISLFLSGLLFTYFSEDYQNKNIETESPFSFCCYPQLINKTDLIFKRILIQETGFEAAYNEMIELLIGTYVDNVSDQTRIKFNKFIYDIFRLQSDIIQPENIDSFFKMFNDIIPKKDNIQYLKEQKEFVFGTLNSPKSFAQDITLTESTKDAVNTLTFSLYSNYYDERGVKEKNPFIDLLHEEDKIKLKYKNKWYDFIITDSDLDSSTNKINYIAKDAFVKELSKIGFNKTFNSELDNNVGTINELSTSVVKDTNWKVNEDKMDKFYQGALRPIIGGTLKNTISIKTSDYYYDKDLKKNNIDSSGFIIKERSFIYIFYDEELKNEENKAKINYKILYLPPISPSAVTTQSDYEKINNILTNVNIYPFVEFRDGNNAFVPSMIEYNINNITITAPDIFDSASIIFDYKIRANDIVTKAITHYSVPLKRYVTEYKDIQNNKTLYGYMQGKYSTKPLVQNLLPNGEDFTSLSGWISGSVNNTFNIDIGLGAATKKNDISTVTPYLNFITSVEGGGNNRPHGFVCNTDLSYNFAGVHELNPGEELILRVQVERGENFAPLNQNSINYISDQLTLMEALRPYLYFYKSVSSLQAKTDESVLPLKSQQVVQFIQDKRYVDTAKYESGLGEQTIANNKESISMYDPSFHNLKDTLNNQGLVSLHWSNYSSTSRSTRIDNKTYDISANNINIIPCAYITRKLAKTWASKGYLQAFENSYQKKNSFGSFKSYYFTYTGWNNFRKLFYEDTDFPEDKRNSTFRLRDFAIIGDIRPKAYQNPSYLGFSACPDSTTHMHYYLPFLFSDEDLKNAIISNGYDTKENVNVNDFYNHFFRYPYWQEVLKTKEYYELSSDNRGGGQLRAYPRNIEIDFGAEENSIAYLALEDYPDFDLLMRMRAFWYLKKYSKTGACIFETQGTFCGKPLFDDSEYTYKTKTVGPIGYTYQDLLTNHLGLFFTFDQTAYDGAKGHVHLAISKVELFKKYEDENGEIILPDKMIESNAVPIYKFYDPDLNKNVISENDIIYENIDIKINSNYVPNIDLTGEKRNSITITESNVYNILQKIAEIFDGWLVIDVEHNEDTGELILDEQTYLPKKEIYFINNRYSDNFSGIKYGINLQKINRKIDSNEIITKLIVKNNNNEFGTNGFCSVARSKYNLNGTNALFNLDYLISTKQLPEEIKNYLYNDIYPKTYAYGQFLAKLITERAEQTVILSHSQAEADYNKLIINEAQEKLSDYQGRYESLNDIDKEVDGKIVGVGYFINNKQATNKKPSGFQNIINSIIFYQGLVDGFTSKYKNSMIRYNDASKKYSLLQDITESITYQRDSLINKFQSLCQGRIREGAWSSEDYIDDDLYYLDSEKQLQEYSQPRVTYNIDIVDISSLPEWSAYTFNLRDKTTMEDPEIFGYDENKLPIKVDIIITEKTSNLQSPDKNTIKVQNYKTQFNDLFQRIASTIQAVEFGTLNYTNKNSTNSIGNRLENNEIGLQALMTYNGI